jgi:hypothetical protein
VLRDLKEHRRRGDLVAGLVLGRNSLMSGGGSQNR